ncbi:hypothetical protein [Subtercola lobariae]|uniref:hypothetical protein n=1 Tax=Subtercola lobariae TaxID=1588641 RepID=UPI00166B7A4A|nr:hypothetical protein [Subtercola lobariae]
MVKLMAIVMKFADDGTPAHSTAAQVLEDGVWEFKVSRKRFTFYDTDGTGSFQPKHRIRNRDASPHREDDYWWFPDFDDSVRLGFVFAKTGQTAGQNNIHESIRVRKEDLSHDENPAIEG